MKLLRPKDSGELTYLKKGEFKNKKKEKGAL